jgi:hypothetical protein
LGRPPSTRITERRRDTMENTRIAGQARESGAPLTDAETGQARYALRELARSRAPLA